MDTVCPPVYSTPKIEAAKRNRQDVNAIVNSKYFLRIPTEEDRWTEEEIEMRTQRIDTERRWCRFGVRCERLQCSYRHSISRKKICKELIALGMPHYNAYQISIRRMKE